MTLKRAIVLCVVALLPLLAGCSSDDKAPDGGVSGSDFQPGQSAGESSRAATVDVCALLSEDDAARVARDEGLSGAQTPETEYTLTKSKVEYPEQQQMTSPTAGCEFSISGGGATGNVVIEVVSAENFSLYAGDGEEVNGLGDEAVSVGGATIVRVDDLMLQTSENSYTEEFVVELYRKMIPNLQ